MRNLARLLCGGLVAVPLAVTASGVVAADDYRSVSLDVGPDGLSTTRTISGVTPDGVAHYLRERVSLGPGGLHTESVSATGGERRPGPLGGLTSALFC